jgi:hypothetical protein
VFEGIKLEWVVSVMFGFCGIRLRKEGKYNHIIIIIIIIIIQVFVSVLVLASFVMHNSRVKSRMICKYHIKDVSYP